MSSYVNQGADIYFNGYRVEGYAKSAEVKIDVESQDKTTIGDTDRTFAPGLNVIEFGIEGYDDYAVTTGMDYRYNLVDGATNNSIIITECPQGNTAGNPSITGQFNMATYNKYQSLGDMVKFTINAKASGTLWFKGTVMEGDRAVSGSGNGTALQLGAVSATQTMNSALHVTQAGTNLVVLIKNAATQGGSYTTRITHTTMSAVGAEIKSSASSLSDTWWRVDWTLAGGNSTFSVCLGIK